MRELEAGQLIETLKEAVDQVQDATVKKALQDLVDQQVKPEMLDKVLDDVEALISQTADEATQKVLQQIRETDDEQLLHLLQEAINKISDDEVKSTLENWTKMLLGTPQDQLALIKAGIDGLPEGEAKQALKSLVEFDVADFKEAKQRVEDWYNDMMKQAAVLYKQNVRRWVVGFALVVTLIMGTDSIHIAKVLWTQPARRAAVAATAPDLMEDFSQSEAAVSEAAGLTTEETLDRLQARAAEVNDIISGLESLDLPLTWWQAPAPTDGQTWLLKVLGLLITWVATAQGSSFWYDLLRRLNPRAAPQSSTTSSSA